METSYPCHHAQEEQQPAVTGVRGVAGVAALPPVEVGHNQQATNGGQECIGSKKRSQECGMAKCPSILYLSESALVWLPSLLPVEGCSVPPYPIPSLYAAVSGIVDNKLTICGGEWSIF